MPATPPLALTYHGVAPVPLRDDPEYLFTHPDALRRHVALLRRWGYRLVRWGDLCDAVAEGRGDGLAALTFDDGFADNRSILLPLLQELDVAATVFVVTGWLGEPHPVAPRHARILTAGEIRELHAAGVEVGAHTRTHPHLDLLPEAAALEELRGSKEDLEALLQAEVRTAAYPFGDADDGVRRAAREAGLQWACRTIGEGDWADPFDQPREAMRNGTTLAGLRLKRRGAYEPFVRSLPGRVVRRAMEHTKGRPLR